MSKKKSKRIMFSYHQVKVISNEIFVRKQLLEEIKNYESKVWNMTGLLKYIKGNPEFLTSEKIRGEQFEIEPESLFQRENLHFFQITKLREDLIPAKKKIGKVRTEIMLDDDEYIGEFTGVVYDDKNGVVLIQSNKYGISLAELKEYFSFLRLRYLKTKSGKEDELMVDLDIVVDKNKISTLKDSKEFRKIKFKGNSVHLAALCSEDETSLKKIGEVMNKFGDLNFELTMSVSIEKNENAEKKSKTLNVSETNELISQYEKLYLNSEEGSKPDLQISRREEINSKVEAVDLLLPKMIDSINIQLEPRKSLGKDSLRENMFELFKTKEAIIYKIFNMS